MSKSKLMAKVYNSEHIINFYRHDGGALGYIFPRLPNPYKPTQTMDLGDGLAEWLEWAEKNGYSILYRGPEAMLKTDEELIAAVKTAIEHLNDGYHYTGDISDDLEAAIAKADPDA